MGDSPRDRYRLTRQAYEAEFERNRQLHGDRIRCRAGCAECCHQLFQITEIEAAALSAGLRSMPEEKQRALKDRARVYLAERARLVSGAGEPEAWGSLPPAGARDPIVEHPVVRAAIDLFGGEVTLVRPAGREPAPPPPAESEEEA